MSEWTLSYWINKSGKQPIEIWLDQLTKEQFKSVAKELKLLELIGCELRLPHSKALGNGIFELRERVFGYRIYYGFLPGKNIVLLHAGGKSSQTKDIQLAHSRLIALYEEMNYEVKKL